LSKIDGEPREERAVGQPVVNHQNEWHRFGTPPLCKFPPNQSEVCRTMLKIPLKLEMLLGVPPVLWEYRRCSAILQTTPVKIPSIDPSLG
jgi:hypothetical protein